jgi:hypothetical protein
VEPVGDRIGGRHIFEGKIGEKECFEEEKPK